MEIYLEDELAYYFIPRFTLEVARDRAEQKKAGLVAGTVGSLLSRPDPGDIQLTSVENRLEPYWIVSAAARIVYDRTRTFTIPASGPEVRHVKVFGQEVPVDKKTKEGPGFTLEGVESCLEERRASRSFSGLTGEKFEAAKYQAFPKTLIVDLDHFTSPEAVIIPPQVRAAAVVRQVLTEVIKPVQNAQVIHEEAVQVETIELNFRPVYALEYEWASRGKRVVVEFDALTGEMTGGGKKLSAQIKGMVSRDLLFDISADAVGMLVPGGGIAVKLVKAVVDRPKSG
jgi:hypothetical protein